MATPHTQILLVALLAAIAPVVPSRTPEPIRDDHARIKQRYIRFLIGTDVTFNGKFGTEAASQFNERVKRPVEKAMAFDFSLDRDKPFRAFPGKPGHKTEVAVYSPLLQQFLLPLAYAYRVNAPGNLYYRNPKVLDTYVRTLDYLHSRGIRDGMTFHNNQHRMNMEGAPRPAPGAANLANMELRMGALCQSVLLMEPHFHDTPAFRNARALIRHLEMLGRTSGHVRYYEPYTNPPAFPHRVQSDAIQNYSDTTLVSALLETDPQRRDQLLTETSHIFTDSLKVIPGWADTIKPDFTGFHHRGIYGNAYTGGFIPQAAFGVHILAGTRYAVAPESVENLKQLMLTYRLYCQKYAMPFGIRGRMPEISRQLTSEVFCGILTYASPLGLDAADMQPVFARLWHPEHVGLGFLFSGGRGKLFRGLYPLEMLRELEVASPKPEPDPSGFWVKPYGGLVIHRRDNWMAAIRGYSKYVWDYENGKNLENVYGQHLSHGMLTIFCQGDPVSDTDSGYRLDAGWDWYRMPGTTAVHFPIRKNQKPLTHRRFSPETFLGAVSLGNRNGAWGMILNQETSGDGTPIHLKARKSAFFFDDLIVLLASGIRGGDGKHPVETTLFQTFLPDPATFPIQTANTLTDAAGNAYYIPDTTTLRTFKGEQKSFRHNGKTPTSGHYAVAWFDHGLAPRNASCEAAILVRGTDAIQSLANNPASRYIVESRTDTLHQVRFPQHHTTAFVCFEPVQPDHPILDAVDTPCLVMAQTDSPRRLQLAVTNPDLGFLPPDAPVPDFRFVSEGHNQYLPSHPRPVRVTLKGNWQLASPAKAVTLSPPRDNHTAILFQCLHGMPLQVALTRN